MDWEATLSTLVHNIVAVNHLVLIVTRRTYVAHT